MAILSTSKRDIFRRRVHAEVLHAALAQMATVKTLLVEASVMKRVMPFGSTAIPLSSEAGHTMCFTRAPSGERTAIFPANKERGRAMTRFSFQEMEVCGQAHARPPMTYPAMLWRRPPHPDSAL